MGYVEQFVGNKHPAQEEMSKIQKLKILHDETGEDLKACHDALEYAGWELPRARDYIKYGW